MRVGLHYWNFSGTAAGEITPALTQVARIADEGGVATLTVMDHYFQMEAMAPADEPMLEAYTTLGYLAGVTERLTLSALVTGVMYRYPGLLAKIVTTLDVLSEGRARLGVGASWYEREQRGLGVPVVPMAERFDRLEETLRICLQMWSDDNGPFEGRYYQLAETLCQPAPVQRPHPPILVGGGGEKRTLPLVARYAQACNLFGTDSADTGDVPHKLDVLRAACDDAGTDYDAILKTVIVQIDPREVDTFVAAAQAYAALGVTEIATGVLSGRQVEMAERVVADIVPRLADL